MVVGPDHDDDAPGIEVPFEAHERDDDPEGRPGDGSPEEEPHALPVAIRRVECGHGHPDDRQVRSGEDEAEPAIRLIDGEECGEADGPEQHQPEAGCDTQAGKLTLLAPAEEPARGDEDQERADCRRQRKQQVSRE
ncbi:hypothetical protein D3C72_1990740 [compost metagenome]